MEYNRYTIFKLGNSDTRDYYIGNVRSNHENLLKYILENKIYVKKNYPEIKENSCIYEELLKNVDTDLYKFITKNDKKRFYIEIIKEVIIQDDFTLFHLTNLECKDKFAHFSFNLFLK